MRVLTSSQRKSGNSEGILIHLFGINPVSWSSFVESHVILRFVFEALNKM